MENIQNLSLLFHEQNVFTAISVGIFFVFICGITKSLLYLAGDKAAYLFDSPAISSYISKTAAPEHIRLKILFLSFPKPDKEIFSQYLKEPEQKPSRAFSKTMEQLKCEILTITNYNRNVAMFFFLVSGVTILSSSVQNFETKILGMCTFGLILFCIDQTCNFIYSALKYCSYRSFKSLIAKLDDFHSIYNAKYRNGFLTEQSPNSPFAKPSFSPQPQKPQLANVNIQTEPQIITTPPLEVLQKRPQQFPPSQSKEAFSPQPQETLSPQSQKEVSPQTALSQNALSQTALSQNANIKQNIDPESVDSLLEKIQTATTNLDFDSFEVLSQKLAALTTSNTLSAKDHQTLQKGLDEFLKEFREVKQSFTSN